MKLQCIDTFSGIGGLSLGLAEFVETVLYCEIDPFCQAVLSQRMADGKLDPAPIHSDIRTLRLPKTSQPTMLCGGFPCQDISCIGLQKGVSNGARSGMFFEMMRIVDECPSISVLFLENVGNILNCGLQEVVDECTKRGFNMAWTTRSAGGGGAPHQRNRWFCLAIRNGTDLSDLGCTPKDTVPTWASEPSPRVSFRPSVCDDTSYDIHWAKRCGALGNAVVPCIVREAFVELVTNSTKWNVIQEHLSEFSMPLESVGYPYPDRAIVLGTSVFPFPKRQPVAASHSVRITMQFNNETSTIGNYPTPRHGMTHPSTVTERAMRDLPTILVHCNESMEHIRSVVPDADPLTVRTLVTPNVQYIEWMMGYPPDWTRVVYASKVVKESGGRPVKHVPEKRVPSNKHRLNGMHVFMKERPGEDVRAVAAGWKQLSDAERQTYTERARIINSQ